MKFWSLKNKFPVCFIVQINVIYNIITYTRTSCITEACTKVNGHTCGHLSVISPCRQVFDNKQIIQVKTKTKVFWIKMPSIKLRFPSNRTLGSICAYGAILSISAVMYMRWQLEDRVRSTEYYKAAMQALRKHKGEWKDRHYHTVCMKTIPL